jgi:glutaminyl-peptide cyclotransferase
MRLYLLILFVTLSLACTKEPVRSNTNMNVNKTNANVAAKTPQITAVNAPVYTYEVVNTYKHDQNAFTEGLFFHNGFLYESTGEKGKSNLRKIELESGKVVQQENLSKQSFGEGTTVLNGKIYQLTWQEERGFIYDAATMKPAGEFRYQGEGWGLTNDGTNLIMSSGMHIIKFINPETFETVRTISVLQENGKPLFLINELEYIKGEIWANIWHSEDKETGTTQGYLPNIEKPNYIVRIDPQTGKILGWIDLDGISPDDTKRDSENTMNGIAYDAATDRIFVTGKNWKNLFEIKVKPKGEPPIKN